MGMGLRRISKSPKAINLKMIFEKEGYEYFEEANNFIDEKSNMQSKNWNSINDDKQKLTEESEGNWGEL